MKTQRKHWRGNWRSKAGRKAATGSRQKIVERSSKKCVECSQETAAYTCPKCSEKYCSLLCYKAHKGNCKEDVDAKVVGVVETKGSASADAGDQGVGNERLEFPQEDTVSMDKLMQIRNDERIKELLKSRQLRALITRLDTMQNPNNAFKNMMDNHEFRALSNAVLEIVGVRKELFNLSDDDL